MRARELLGEDCREPVQLFFMSWAMLWSIESSNIAAWSEIHILSSITHVWDTLRLSDG